MLIDDELVEIDESDFRGNGIETVPDERSLEELEQEFAARADGLDCRTVGDARLFFFQRANNGVSRVPFLRKTPGMLPIHRTIPDEAKKLFQRWLTNQIEIFVRILLRGSRDRRLRFVDCRRRFQFSVQLVLRRHRCHVARSPSRSPRGRNHILFHHHDQNSTLIACAMRRVTKSRARFRPQRIFAWPVISGLSSSAGFSICVVTIIVCFALLDDDTGATGRTGVSLALPLLFPSRLMETKFTLP